MSFVISILSVTGIFAICFGTMHLVFQIIEFHLSLQSDIRDCKREIERLETLVKGHCK